MSWEMAWGVSPTWHGAARRHWQGGVCTCAASVLVYVRGRSSDCTQLHMHGSARPCQTGGIAAGGATVVEGDVMQVPLTHSCRGLDLHPTHPYPTPTRLRHVLPRALPIGCLSCSVSSAKLCIQALAVAYRLFFSCIPYCPSKGLQSGRNAPGCTTL